MEQADEQSRTHRSRAELPRCRRGCFSGRDRGRQRAPRAPARRAGPGRRHHPPPRPEPREPPYGDPIAQERPARPRRERRPGGRTEPRLRPAAQRRPAHPRRRAEAHAARRDETAPSYRSVLRVPRRRLRPPRGRRAAQRWWLGWRRRDSRHQERGRRHLRSRRERRAPGHARGRNRDRLRGLRARAQGHRTRALAHRRATRTDLTRDRRRARPAARPARLDRGERHRLRHVQTRYHATPDRAAGPRPRPRQAARLCRSRRAEPRRGDRAFGRRPGARHELLSRPREHSRRCAAE